MIVDASAAVTVMAGCLVFLVLYVPLRPWRSAVGVVVVALVVLVFATAGLAVVDMVWPGGWGARRVVVSGLLVGAGVVVVALVVILVRVRG